MASPLRRGPIKVSFKASSLLLIATAPALAACHSG